MDPSTLFAATPTAVQQNDVSTSAMLEAQSASAVAAPVAPAEPLLLPADYVAAGIGLLFHGVRSIAWGLVLIDIIGRQMSTTYRNASYQLVHSRVPNPFAGLGRIALRTDRKLCPIGYSMQPEVKSAVDAYGNVAPGQPTGRMTCQPNRAGTTLVG